MYRCHKAIEAPDSYLSIVSDGMAQGHSKLPWLANLAGSSKSLPQHIQGIIAHGRTTLLFRTFHTVSHTANLQIHCLLLTLEKMKVNGKSQECVNIEYY